MSEAFRPRGGPVVGITRKWTVEGVNGDGAMPDPPRRFPAPWRANKMPGGGYVVRDANGAARGNARL
jgi:hypothetical protein